MAGLAEKDGAGHGSDEREEGPDPAMKVLFIGGTGCISAAVSRMAIAEGFELYLLNRGLRTAGLPGSHSLTADVHSPSDVRAALRGLEFDAVVDWIAYTPDDIERDLELFGGRVGQYVFISSASVYEKPPRHYLITESTPLRNPFWQYAQDKIACEERLMRAYRDDGFPVTIVRPSMTYDANLPIAVGGWGTYTLADRLVRGRPIIVHGDGSSLWVVTHADDLGRGLLGLLGNERAVGEAFHITSDEVLTWNQIYQAIAEGLGVEADIVARAVRSHRAGGPAAVREACSATRRGAWCSTTARSSRSCPGSRPRCPSRRASRGRLRGSRPTRAPLRGRERERGDGPDTRGLRTDERVGERLEPRARRQPVSEWDKMLRGDPYDASDSVLVEARMRARRLTQRLGALDPADTDAHLSLLARAARRHRVRLLGRGALLLRLRYADSPRVPRVRQHGLRLPRRGAHHAR